MTDSPARNAALKQMLSERRCQIQTDVASRIRDGRHDRPRAGGDELEVSDAHIQEDIELALLQMRAETVIRIDKALARLDAGTYGSCSECQGEISERRLRALPFALRCQACEGRRENEQVNARQAAQRNGNPMLFPDALGF